MKFTHTPGPWHKANDIQDIKTDIQRIYAGNYIGNDETIASVHALQKLENKNPTAAFYEAMANARLIAAAPDLLLALSGLVEAVEQFTNADAFGWPELDEARKALRRAALPE